MKIKYFDLIFKKYFLICDWDVAIEDENYLSIVRIFWRYDVNKCTLALLWSFSLIWTWPRHRLWYLFCKQGIFWIGVFIACTGCWMRRPFFFSVELTDQYPVTLNHQGRGTMDPCQMTLSIVTPKLKRVSSWYSGLSVG